ncbi:MAG: PQQ-dependent sugar dehydrogenase, partial [Burkholderiales bacterium]
MKIAMRTFNMMTLLLFTFHFCVSAAAGNLPLDKIKLPPGFAISIFAEVPGARSMTLGTDGTVFVGTFREGKVYAVTEKKGENRSDRVYTLAENMEAPNGVAFRNGSLYVAEIGRILRYDNIEANLANPPKPKVVNDKFPKDFHHGWKFIAFGPDGWLYVPVGAPCNICEPDPDRYALISRIKPDGTGYE